MGRQKVLSASPYEKTIGFCRAMRVGNAVYVSGTGPIAPDGSTASVGNAYGQAKRCLEIIKEALESTGASMAHVVRTRMYVTDVAKWEAIGTAHGEYFSEIQPTATMVVVKGLVRDDWYVEIEADAIIDREQNPANE